MNLKVLQFQNKKLCERLEELKTSEEKLTEQIHAMKEKRDSDFAIISVFNRHWMQVMIMNFENKRKHISECKSVAKFFFRQFPYCCYNMK